MLAKVSICLFAITQSLVGTSQVINEKDFVRYTIKEGISDNYVTALTQDEEGYIWIGTDGGLDRFDGHSFQKHSSSTRPLKLLSTKIWRLKSLPNGQLAILSDGGLQLVKTKNFSTRNFIVDSLHPFSTYQNNAWDIMIMPDKTIGMSTSTGFYVFDSTGKIQYRYDAYHPTDVDKRTIRYARDILSIGNGQYLVYVNPSGLATYDPRKRIFKELERNNRWKAFVWHPSYNDFVYVLRQQISEEEFVFINHRNDSIVYYNHRTGKYVQSKLPFNTFLELNFTSRLFPFGDSKYILNSGTQGMWQLTIDRQTGTVTCDPHKYFPDERITSVYYDKDQRLWLGTSNGVLQQKMNPSFLQPFVFNTEILQDDQDGLFIKAIRYKDRLFVSRQSRNTGLVVLDTATMKPVKVIQFYGRNNVANEISAMQMYYPDTLWLHSTAGLLWLDTKTYRYGKVTEDKRFPAKLDEFSTLAPISKAGDAWVCKVMEGVIGRYEPATRKLEYFTDSTVPRTPFKRVKMITYDSYGDVWIGGHSLTRWNRSKKMFDTLISVYAGPKKFNDNILVLQADDRGSLWFYNAHNALVQYHIQQKKYSVYTTADGLPSDKIDALSPGLNNTLWLATRTALVHLDLATKKIRSLQLPDSISVKKFGSVPITIDSIGGFGYLIGKNEILKFPIHLPEAQEYSRDLQIHSITINNKKTIYNTTGQIKLAPHENNLSIHFHIIDFESDGYSFSYKLKNTNEWIDLGAQRNLILTDLPPGHYDILLRSTNKTGTTKTAAITFFIRPPFWKTLWFFALVLALLGLGVYLVYHRRVSRIRQRAELDREVARIEMKALHTQMNPHFIFNCLNSIKMMILDNENGKASRYLSKFAQLIRLTLNQSTKAFISLRNTIDYLQLYLQMEQTRTDQFEYSLEVSDDLNPEEIYIPPMLIQPFIENAIWHGSTGGHTKTRIQIQFFRNEDDLVCKITDNGVGIEAALKKKETNMGHNSLGIANVRQRMQVLNEKYNLHARLTIEDRGLLSNQEVSGTLVTIILSIKTTDV